jgi:carbonic anhydrase
MSKQTSSYSSQEALQKLLEGNKRYIGATMSYPNQTKQRRTELLQGQFPFAVVLGCADSRIPPEILFDQGIGDIFVIRVAGNITSPEVIGSIEYAVEHLSVPLVMVMGHESCGAVGATVDAVANNVDVPGNVGSVVEAIKPAVQRVQATSENMVENAVRANVELVVEQLKASKPLLSSYVEQGKVRIVGSYYSMKSGEVDIIVS